MMNPVVAARVARKFQTGADSRPQAVSPSLPRNAIFTSPTTVEYQGVFDTSALARVLQPTLGRMITSRFIRLTDRPVSNVMWEATTERGEVARGHVECRVRVDESRLGPVATVWIDDLVRPTRPRCPATA